MIFLRRDIWVPKGVRCCSTHLYKGYLSYEVQQSAKQLKVDDVLLNRDDVVKRIDDFRLALKHNGSFDFDDPGTLDNETYKTTYGLDQGTLFNCSHYVSKFIYSELQITLNRVYLCLQRVILVKPLTL